MENYQGVEGDGEYWKGNEVENDGVMKEREGNGVKEKEICFHIFIYLSISLVFVTWSRGAKAENKGDTDRVLVKNTKRVSFENPQKIEVALLLLLLFRSSLTSFLLQFPPISLSHLLPHYQFTSFSSLSFPSILIHFSLPFILSNSLISLSPSPVGSLHSLPR